MANILDYLDWRGDLTLAERGFNEVDNLLMAELCFLDFSGIVPADFSAPVSLPEAMQKYDAARPQETMGVLVPEQIPELGHKMAASRRFSDLTLCAYVSRTDEETQTQFSALTALLPDKTAYIAFRGTDDTIVGWKEDFNLAFLPVVPAQRMAAEYLAAAAAALPSHPLRVGGHSKGGNLAVYSAVFCGEAVQNQLMRVYNNDGPGFRTSLLGLPEHRRVADKITTILPGKSLKAMRTALGWTCWPSQISSAATASRSLPAAMGPGLRWWMPGIALYRCVRWLAPASKSVEASSYVQSVCSMETVQSLLASFVNSTAPGSSAATSAMRMRPSDTS